MNQFQKIDKLINLGEAVVARRKRIGRKSVGVRGTQNQDIVNTLNTNNIQLDALSFSNNNGSITINVGPIGTSNINQGDYSIAIGSNAGKSNQGDYSIAIGTSSGEISQGDIGIAIGNQAGKSNSQSQTIQIGRQAGYSDSFHDSIAIGAEAGFRNLNERSIAIGQGSAYCNLGSYSIAIGDFSGRLGNGECNVTIGFQSSYIKNNTNNNVTIGNQASYANQNNNSIAIGVSAGRIDQSDNCIAIGSESGNRNQSINSIAIGSVSAYENQGSNSIAIGAASGSTQGNNCIAIGSKSGRQQKDLSVTIGTDSGGNQGTGCVAIGYGSGGGSCNNCVVFGINTFGQITQSNTFFVKNIKEDSTTPSSGVLCYDISRGEIFQDTGKTFVIDHPVNNDKYLIHACLEGPEAGVYYRGEGRCESLKKVKIFLPKYVKHFSNFNVFVSPTFDSEESLKKAEDIRIIASDVIDNYFIVVSNCECSFDWIVYATRMNIETEVPSSKKIEKIGPYTFFSM